MRSSTTAGLTPQQLLDRRRAQNKLAQRRFREKARLARSGGLSSSTYYLDERSSGRPTIPSRPDSTADTSLSPVSANPRVRSASTDSSLTSSTVSLSSQVSSPTSTCTEINTPTVLNLSSKGMRPTEAIIVSNISNPPLFGMDEIKPTSFMADAALRMPPPQPSASLPPVVSTYIPPSYVPLESDLLQATSLAPPSQSLTYDDIVGSSSSQRNIGLKIVGMHTDPFLMSHPLPSPSLVPGPAARSSIPPDTMFLAPPFSCRTVQEETRPQPSTSFEHLLRVTSQSSSCSSASEKSSKNSSYTTPSSTCSMPSKSKVESDAAPLAPLSQRLFLPNNTVASQCVNSRLGKAISQYVRIVDAGGCKHASQPIAIVSQPFARAIELIGHRFGLTRNGEGVAQLLSRLELDGRPCSHETSKGLVFDSTIPWNTMPPNMLPTTEQLLYPHCAFVDACLPWPVVRSRLLKHALTNPLCEEEFALDLLLSILSPDEALASVRVHGDDVLDPEAWELSERLWTKWSGLFDESIVRRTNWWRRQRGLGNLCILKSNESASGSVHPVLGTGSLDQNYHLITTLL